ncbi:MAG: hypothetical protein IT560_05605 [Alphaproteobacteria bacterium]|nr:hypothetical protein [Alphaproteobacteria bacterium]
MTDQEPNIFDQRSEFISALSRADIIARLRANLKTIDTLPTDGRHKYHIGKVEDDGSFTIESFASKNARSFTQQAYVVHGIITENNSGCIIRTRLRVKRLPLIGYLALCTVIFSSYQMMRGDLAIYALVLDFLVLIFGASDHHSFYQKMRSFMSENLGARVAKSA